MKISDLRTDYMRESLDESSVSPDPLRQFGRWLDEAVKSQMKEPNAMTLATVGVGGRPSARIVLLKAFDDRGFMFFTNYLSRKGHELAGNDAAALLFFWPDLERQIRLEGVVTKAEPAESVAYFAERPRPSQLGAWASPQSEPIAGRAALEAELSSVVARYGESGDAVPRPPHWGGYRLLPDTIEFWQGRASRLHDRIRYRRVAGRPAVWTIDRLAP